jgi:hypothetical protein
VGKRKAVAPAAKQITSVADLTPDDRNLNLGTERGIGMLEHSLGQYGYGRSILADKDGRIIAGNKTLEGAVTRGLSDDDIIIVPTDGRKLVVVQRTDLSLDTKEGRQLALLDNRIAQIDLDWNAEELMALEEEGQIELAECFFENEIADLDTEATIEAGGDSRSDSAFAESLFEQSAIDKQKDKPTVDEKKLFGGETVAEKANGPSMFWQAKALVKGDVIAYCCPPAESTFAHFDPFQSQDASALLAAYDVVIANSVLCAQPADHLITLQLLALHRLCRPAGRVLISIRNDRKPGIHQLKRGGVINAKPIADWQAFIAEFFTFDLLNSDGYLAYACKPLKVSL